uniref:Uncharacterized protein n=1 Tax=Picea sitchensis TaxID=3332 RepID=A9NYF9_PICSI|nr:unknown [Picea sitchensis]
MRGPMHPVMAARNAPDETTTQKSSNLSNKTRFKTTYATFSNSS